MLVLSDTHSARIITLEERLATLSNCQCRRRRRHRQDEEERAKCRVLRATLVPIGGRAAGAGDRRQTQPVSQPTRSPPAARFVPPKNNCLVRFVICPSI